MANRITASQIDASIIYEGGGITEITADELKGNIVAIRQLINHHNLTASDNKNKDKEIQTLKSENEYLNTSPFVSIVAAIINLIGSLIIGLSTELIGNELQDPKGHTSTKNIVFVSCGIILVIVGSFATILYPKAKNYFNKKKE